MASDENDKLKNRIVLLEQELMAKNSEVMIYRQELTKFSDKLDLLMSQMASDLKLLAQVQKTLMPTELPNIGGVDISRKFVFGSKYGGDYFDIFEHEDKMKFGILVASSSGYAMSALFLSIILKISHVLEAKKGNKPDKILQQIADDIKNLAGPSDRTSAFYAVIDRRTFELEFCSAGNINGYYSAPNKPLQILKSTNSAFAQQFSEKLTLAQVELEPKSRIIVVTDGLESILGANQIAKIISEQARCGVHELRNELLFQASRISGKLDPERDQTVVVIEVKDRVIKLAK